MVPVTITVTTDSYTREIGVRWVSDGYQIPGEDAPGLVSSQQHRMLYPGRAYKRVISVVI